MKYLIVLLLMFGTVSKLSAAEQKTGKKTIYESIKDAAKETVFWSSVASAVTILYEILKGEDEGDRFTAAYCYETKGANKKHNFRCYTLSLGAHGQVLYDKDGEPIITFFGYQDHPITCHRYAGSTHPDKKICTQVGYNRAYDWKTYHFFPEYTRARMNKIVERRRQREEREAREREMREMREWEERMEAKWQQRMRGGYYCDDGLGCGYHLPP